MFYDTDSAETGESICNLFTNFFQGMFRPYQQLYNHYNVICDNTNISSFVTFSTEEIWDKKKSLDSSKGAGFDGYPV